MNACPPQRNYCPLEVAQSWFAVTRGLLSAKVLTNAHHRCCMRSVTYPSSPRGRNLQTSMLLKLYVLAVKRRGRLYVCVLEQQISQVSIRGRNSTLSWDSLFSPDYIKLCLTSSLCCAEAHGTSHRLRVWPLTWDCLIWHWSVEWRVALSNGLMVFLAYDAYKHEIIKRIERKYNTRILHTVA